MFRIAIASIFMIYTTAGCTNLRWATPDQNYVTGVNGACPALEDYGSCRALPNNQ